MVQKREQEKTMSEKELVASRESVTFTTWDYLLLSLPSCGGKRNRDRKKLYNTGSRMIDDKLDIIKILNKLNSLDSLLGIILTPE